MGAAKMESLTASVLKNELAAGTSISGLSAAERK
jgi:hypothetical protein